MIPKGIKVNCVICDKPYFKGIKGKTTNHSKKSIVRGWNSQTCSSICSKIYNRASCNGNAYKYFKERGEITFIDLDENDILNEKKLKGGIKNNEK